MSLLDGATVKCRVVVEVQRIISLQCRNSMSVAVDDMNSLQGTDGAHPARFVALAHVPSVDLDESILIFVFDYFDFDLSQTKNAVREIIAPMARFRIVRRLVGKVHRVRKRRRDDAGPALLTFGCCDTSRL